MGRVPEPTSLPARVDVAVVPVGPDGHVEPAEVLRVLRGRGPGAGAGRGRRADRVVVLRGRRAGPLYLTVALVLIGDGVPGLRFDGEDRLADALRAPARRFLLGEDTCTELVLHT